MPPRIYVSVVIKTIREVRKRKEGIYSIMCEKCRVTPSLHLIFVTLLFFDVLDNFQGVYLI